MGTTTKTLIRYRNTLIEYVLIKKVVKQKSSSEGYDHNLYQIGLLDRENILLLPAEKLAEDKEEIISGIAESPSSNQDNPKKVIIDNKKSIDKIILNYSLEEIKEKLELLKIKRNIINPAGWFIAALKANYLNPESFKEENDEEEKIIKTGQIESESKVIKPEKITLEKKQEEKKRLSREEELKWIKKIRNYILK
jgi:hypothetical protein